MPVQMHSSQRLLCRPYFLMSLNLSLVTKHFTGTRRQSSICVNISWNVSKFTHVCILAFWCNSTIRIHHMSGSLSGFVASIDVDVYRNASLVDAKNVIEQLLPFKNASHSMAF